MDIVYTSLRRRPTARLQPAGEVAEVLGILWAHTTPEDGLEHITGSLDDDRVDLVMFLLPPAPTGPTARTPLRRVAALLTRSHQASPALHRRYLPPRGTPDPPAEDPGHRPA